MGEIRRAIVSGTPYEQGLQQGHIFSDLIRENIRFLKEDLERSNLNLHHYNELTIRNAAFLEKDQPEQWEEMHGIADGAQLPFDDILMINVPTHFMRNCFSQECSMILVRGNATADGYTYLVKNRDLELTVHQVLVEYHYSDGMSITETGGAGIITYPSIGINSFGLSVTSTGTATGTPGGVAASILDDTLFDHNHIFVNIHHLLRNCHTAHEVLTTLDSYPRINGLNVIAADKTSAAVIEMERTGYQVQWAADDGVLFRTNHYCLDGYREKNATREVYPSTYLRYERISQLLEQCRGHVRFQDLLRILSDHANGPVNSLCCHQTEHSPRRTVSCGIVVLEDSQLFTTPGNPCEHLIHTSL